MQQLLGLILLIGIIAFVVFAFRQGQKVKPRKGDNSTDAASIYSDRP